METILIILAVGTLSIACFLIGVKVGRHEPVEVPDVSRLNPVTIYREHKAKSEAQEEADKVAKILENIERYDGTGEGQKDIE